MVAVHWYCLQLYIWAFTKSLCPNILWKIFRKFSKGRWEPNFISSQWTCSSSCSNDDRVIPSRKHLWRWVQSFVILFQDCRTDISQMSWLMPSLEAEQLQNHSTKHKPTYLLLSKVNQLWLSTVLMYSKPCEGLIAQLVFPLYVPEFSSVYSDSTESLTEGISVVYKNFKASYIIKAEQAKRCPWYSKMKVWL